MVVLDALTYAGNLGTIASDIDNERCFLRKGDICDRDLADQLFAEYKFDYIVNFAAESHVDRSIENPQLFLQTNIWELKTCWMRPAVPGDGKNENGYPTGVKMYVTTRYLQMRYTAAREQKVSLLKQLPLCPHSHIVPPRQALI